MIPVITALWRREIVKFLRDRSRLLGALVQPLAFWILLGLGFHGTFVISGAEEVSYMEYLYPGIITLVLLFTAIFSTISVVLERQQGFLQAALVAPVPRSVIVLGLVSGGATLAVAEAALFLLLAPVAGFYPGVLGILVILLVSALTALAFTALGFIMAWRLDTTRGFHAVMNLFLMPLWFLSGAVFPAGSLPAELRWLVAIDPVTYSVAAIRWGLYAPGEAPVVLPHVGFSLVITALFALAMLALAVWTVRRPLFSS